MSDLSKAKLLIIEDEEELREVLGALLSEITPDITSARNGLEAIELLQKSTFDAILSDEKMPKKGGLEVLRWIKENDIKTPFIIHTGYGHDQMSQVAKDLGCFAFIDKPWDEERFIGAVTEALKLGLSQRSN